MKLHRALAVAAATAVIAPLALLATAPAAFAEGESSPAQTSSGPTADESSTVTPTPTTPETQTSQPGGDDTTPTTTPPTDGKSTEPADDSDTDTGTDTTGTPSTTPSTTPPATTTPPAKPETPDPVPSECADQSVEVDITGLPGRITAGSGWHEFSLNVLNDSDSTLTDLGFFAGAASDADGYDLFRSKQVQLQTWNPADETWEDLSEEGYAAGFVGYTDELKPGYEVELPLRINVTSAAPVGAGFSLGMTVYGDEDAQCTGYGQAAYRFEIVGSGTDTEGTRPQEGGKAPVTDDRPGGSTPQVTGNLAETGSSSALPVIGLVGGAAVVLGAGAVFVVRRRKTGTDA
ncbi:LAETG motif-containing sortase-dependent surface protein [Streptomyces sp. NPDC048290]|uniref:LAETG motif-containing sortase-dependent surface protein n=1 Tax=Streptomyces sp. NPDC048290 TaxID=3155811 RepID=UPI003442D363